MHPPQASGKTREFDLPEVSFVVNINNLNRGRLFPCRKPSFGPGGLNTHALFAEASWGEHEASEPTNGIVRDGLSGYANPSAAR